MYATNGGCNMRIYILCLCIISAACTSVGNRSHHSFILITNIGDSQRIKILSDNFVTGSYCGKEELSGKFIINEAIRDALNHNDINSGIGLANVTIIESDHFRMRNSTCWNVRGNPVVLVTRNKN